MTGEDIPAAADTGELPSVTRHTWQSVDACRSPQRVPATGLSWVTLRLDAISLVGRGGLRAPPGNQFLIDVVVWGKCVENGLLC